MSENKKYSQEYDDCMEVINKMAKDLKSIATILTITFVIGCIVAFIYIALALSTLPAMH